jgi:hypothetical protein
MTRKEVFFFGAVGGVLPILVSILSIDLSPIIDHPDSLTLGNYIGFGLRVVALIIAGGVVALMNCNVKTPLTPVTLVQLGVTAPALLTSFINAGGPVKEANAVLSRHASAPFAIVSSANAAEASPQDRIQVAQSSVFKDIGAGFSTRLDSVSRANQASQKLGTFCVTSQGKSPLPGAAQPIGSECASGGQKGLVTN